MKQEREFGIIVYGATGFTGRLVCEYLHQRYGVGGEVSWAMAGRSQEKLEQVRDLMSISPEVSLLTADASSPTSLNELASQAHVILTTVGPYQLYGSDLVRACAESGTDYVDLCGEPGWMHEMIGKYQSTAEQSGARIVFSCGFDSVPFDLGVLYLQQQAKEKFNTPLPRVKGRVRAMKGTFSGGTLASFKATMARAANNPELVQVLTDPFSLTADFSGPQQPAGLTPVYDEDLGSWSAPFVMATINTKNIHRSNYLLDHPYGEEFVYDEMMLTGPGDKGEAMATAVANDKSMANDPTQPGEGPSKEERENGFYDVLFAGSDGQDRSIAVSVSGDKDPGYGSTSKMISECAVCLLLNPNPDKSGMLTPASAMGEALIERLVDNAGLEFKLEA